MRRMLFSLVVAACIAAAGQAAQPSATALCDGVAAAIRSNPKITTGTWQDFIWNALVSAARPRIEANETSLLSGTAVDDGDRAKFVSQFRTRFNPSPALGKALDEFLKDYRLSAEILAAPGGPLHAVMDESGSMHCQEFMFFRTSTAGPSQPVDALPRKDAQDDGSFCWGNSGRLGRVDGQVAFIEQLDQPLINAYSLRIVPFRENSWAGGCAVDIKFRSSFEAWRVYVDASGPSKTALTAAAPQIAKVRGDPGASLVPDRDAVTFRRMLLLASDLHGVPMPTFGAPVQELSPHYSSLERYDMHPLVLEGRTYLMLQGNATIGWRDFPETLIILYTLRDDKLTPVASAIVKMHRDGIQSLRVTPSR